MIEFSVPSAGGEDIQSEDWIYLSPISSISNQGPVQFRLDGSDSQYVDLAATYLKLRLKVVTTDDKNIGTLNNVAPIPAFFHSLFSSVVVEMNGVTLDTTTGLYPYCAYISLLCNFDQTESRTQLEKPMG